MPFRLELVVCDRLKDKQGAVSGKDFSFNEEDEQGSLLYLKLFNDFLNSFGDSVLLLGFVGLLLSDSLEGVEFDAESTSMFISRMRLKIFVEKHQSNV